MDKQYSPLNPQEKKQRPGTSIFSVAFSQEALYLGTTARWKRYPQTTDK
jgi:hypothetical protein